VIKEYEVHVTITDGLQRLAVVSAVMILRILLQEKAEVSVVRLKIMFVDRMAKYQVTEIAAWRPLTLRRLMSYIYGAPILDVSRSHTTTQHSR